MKSRIRVRLPPPPPNFASGKICRAVARQSEGGLPTSNSQLVPSIDSASLSLRSCNEDGTVFFFPDGKTSTRHACRVVVDRRRRASLIDFSRQMDY